jgi:RNA polymerase sigma-70 factor, ECF subfamily
MDQKDHLMLLRRAGDAQAFDSFVRSYGGRMHAVARRFFPHREDGADAVQDALLAAYRSIDSFEGSLNLWTWFYRILVNACLGIRRSRSRHPVTSLAELTGPMEERVFRRRSCACGAESAHTQVARAETQAQVRSGIERLPEPYRQVLFLRDIEELDSDQTAQRLGISPGAVKSRLHRARQALRAHL